MAGERGGGGGGLVISISLYWLSGSPCQAAVHTCHITRYLKRGQDVQHGTNGVIRTCVLYIYLTMCICLTRIYLLFTDVFIYLPRYMHLF